MSAPEKVFRIGAVSAAVFGNDVETDAGRRRVRNVSVQRRYRDGDEWKSSTTFGLTELPAAIRVLQLAQQHVEAEEAEVTGS